jgi:23S rRNA pseudouridine1911/1915/1917 synthase
MSFSDPLTGEPITVSSELPEDIKSLFPTGGIVWKR